MQSKTSLKINCEKQMYLSSCNILNCSDEDPNYNGHHPKKQYLIRLKLTIHCKENVLPTFYQLKPLVQVVAKQQSSANVRHGYTP